MNFRIFKITLYSKSLERTHAKVQYDTWVQFALTSHMVSHCDQKRSHKLLYLPPPWALFMVATSHSMPGCKPSSFLAEHAVTCISRSLILLSCKAPMSSSAGIAFKRSCLLANTSKGTCCILSSSSNLVSSSPASSMRARSELSITYTNASVLSK